MFAFGIHDKKNRKLLSELEIVDWGNKASFTI